MHRYTQHGDITDYDGNPLFLNTYDGIIKHSGTRIHTLKLYERTEKKAQKYRYMWNYAQYEAQIRKQH